MAKKRKKLPANCKRWPDCPCIFRGNAERDCDDYDRFHHRIKKYLAEPNNETGNARIGGE